MFSTSQGFETDNPTIISPSSRDCDGNAGLSTWLMNPRTIIKGKSRECLWHAEATNECVTICKFQLKVIAF